MTSYLSLEYLPKMANTETGTPRWPWPADEKLDPRSAVG